MLVEVVGVGLMAKELSVVLVLVADSVCPCLQIDCMPIANTQANITNRDLLIENIFNI
jgi:hypothetical protein